MGNKRKLEQTITKREKQKGARNNRKIRCSNKMVAKKFWVTRDRKLCKMGA